MRIVDINVLRADGGWRAYSFLKISTDEGLEGWSEFVEGSWSPGLADVIMNLGRTIVGEDPRSYSRISSICHAVTRFAPGGLNHQSIAAIENACLDIASKACNMSVSSYLGGPLRKEIKLYWTHCGTFRLTYPDIFEGIIGNKPLRTLDDYYNLGKEALDRGFNAVKTNPVIFNRDSKPELLNPGFLKHGLDLSRSINASHRAAILEPIKALKEGLGEESDLFLDFNFGLSIDSLIKVAKDLEFLEPAWIEFDLHNPEALADIRSKSGIPIASLESIYGRKGYLPYLQSGSVDVVIIDVLWNGLREALRIAELAETFELNVAPHNFYGPLGDLITAHFSASVPGLSIMEIEADDMPWKYQLLTNEPVIKDGCFYIPEGPGWGADIDEDKIREHPWNGNQT